MRYLPRLLFVLFSTLTSLICSAQENYVRTEEFLEPTRDANAPVRKRVTTVYYDGLGRERWRVTEGAYGASPVTSRTDYDRRGNLWRQWLPVSGDVRTPSSYESKATALYGDFQYPYSQISYEESGRNRPIFKEGPGKDWKGKGVKTEYHRCAPSGEYACRMLKADHRAGKVTIGRIHAPGALAVTEVIDEDGMRTLTFKDIHGRVMLERRIGLDSIVADTRFVYDGRMDLRYVISPEGVSRIGDSGCVDDDILQNNAQAFEYDFLHKMISSRLPGCGKTEYVYDKLNRVIMTSDSVQRACEEWTVTKYNDTWKPAIRGTAKIKGATRESLQAIYRDSVLVETFVPDYNNMEYALQYTNNCGPAGFEPYEAWYYNNYKFMVGPAASKRTFFETPHDVGATYTAVGLCTGRAFIDVNRNCYYRAMKYDGYDNLVATMQWDCYMNLERYSTNSEFNFTRQPVSVTETYEEMAEGTVVSKRTATRAYTYDDWGRVATETLSVDGSPAVTVCENSYDEIGRLTSRSLGNATVSYKYDIRQHATDIASDAYTERSSYTKASDGNTRSYKFVNSTTDSWCNDQAITLDYGYDGLGRMKEAVSVDGTLAEKIEVDLDANVVGVERTYNNEPVQCASIQMDGALPSEVHDSSSPYYTDVVGRFASGDYTMTYDSNGRLTSDGTRGVTSVTYHPWLNLPLLIKFDSGDWTKSEYLPDGTLLSRFTQTRRIDPVSTTNQATAINAETAEPLAVSPTLRTTRRYRGSFEIVSGAEKYTRVNTSTGYYDCTEKRHYYYLTNRQGSVMAVIDDEGKTVQRTGFYPSGTPFILPSDYKSSITAATSSPAFTPTTDRLHIGNRWLGHSGLNRYDNTARLHDPLLMRFDTPDPLATKFPGINPWSHTAANPANAIDRTGTEIVLDGDDSDEALKQINSAVRGLNITKDKNGHLQFCETSSTLNIYGEKIKEIISATNITVNLKTQKSADLETGGFMVGGAYLGNKYQDESKTVITYQAVMPSVLSKMDKNTIQSGCSILHEITESYEGGRIALETQISSPMSETEESTYKIAHKMATAQPINISEKIIDNGNTLEYIYYVINPLGLIGQPIFNKTVVK